MKQSFSIIETLQRVQKKDGWKVLGEHKNILHNRSNIIHLKSENKLHTGTLDTREKQSRQTWK